MTTDYQSTRNAQLPQLVEMLQEQHVRKLDVVAPAGQIRSEEGVIVLKGTEAVIDHQGVTRVDGRYLPTPVADEGIAEKLGVPLAYLRRLRTARPDLYDANVNAWLHGRNPKTRLVDGEQVVIREGIPGDGRSFMLRLFRGDEGGEGILRGFLSSKYNIFDNYDVLIATLGAVRDAGINALVDGADLTDRRMYVRIAVPEIAQLAPELLKGYRSPFSGDSGADNPTVFAGIEIQNSEVGNGAFTITPRLVVQVCTNGLTITRDALRAVHLGGRLDAGVIDWSDETQQRNLDLITAKTRDAVRTFLNVEYMRRAIEALTAAATTPVTRPADTIKELGKKLAFDEATCEGVLEHFIRGGDLTAGGVMQAMTSFAQTVADGDAAHELESNAVKAMDLVTR